MSLYKVLTNGDDSVVLFYAESVLQFKLMDSTDIFAKPTISLKDGSLIWASFNGAINYDTVKQLRVCPVNAFYDKDT